MTKEFAPTLEPPVDPHCAANVAIRDEREAFEAWAKEYGRIFTAKDDSGQYTNQWTREAWVGWQARASHAQACQTIDDLCARIKAADDAAADRDYMLDSNDCIAVLRGEWKAPLAMDKPERPSNGQAPAPTHFGDEAHVAIPQMLLGAACSAIDKKRDGTKVLAELRRYTTGDLSQAIAPAPAAVAGPVAFTAEHVTYIRRYGGSCRDCADENGVCPNRGLPCADSEKAIRFVLEALAYGINHGYIAAPTTQPAPAAVAGPSEAVAYLDIGAGGYLDLGTDLTDEALSRLPKGRHALVIAGTYGIDGYIAAPTTQPDPQLPERDASVPAEQQGLFRKFDVRRVDGSDQPGGKHHGCRYFVLDVDHDQHAHDALTAYAAACESSHPELAADLRTKWGAASPTTPPAPAAQSFESDGWLHENGLLYRLTDERYPTNRDEINVTMADGSRSIESRSRRALELLNRIRGVEQ